MLEVKKINGKKAGTVSIEISLSAIMAVAILFLVLGLFSNNLKSIAEASGLANLFKRNNEVAKTFDSEVKSFNNTTRSQVNVQLVAEQGLDYYVSNALATIAKYKETPPTDQAQVEDLAIAATAAKFNEKLDSTDEGAFYSKYLISIDPDNGSANVGNKSITYTKKIEINNNSTTNNPNNEMLIATKQILNSHF